MCVVSFIHIRDNSKHLPQSNTYLRTSQSSVPQRSLGLSFSAAHAVLQGSLGLFFVAKKLKISCQSTLCFHCLHVHKLHLSPFPPFSFPKSATPQNIVQFGLQNGLALNSSQTKQRIISGWFIAGEAEQTKGPFPPDPFFF